MKILVITLIFLSSLFSSALENYANMNNTQNSVISTNSFGEKKIDSGFKIPEILTPTEIKNINKKTEQISKNSVAVASYFLPEISFSNCTAKCPPLKVKSDTLYTRLISFNINTGDMVCEVRNTDGNRFPNAIATARFTNSQCVNQFKKVEYKSQLSSSSIEFNEKQQKSLEFDIELLKKDDKQINIADYIDALVSFDTQIFNIKDSIESQEIKFQNGMTFDRLKFNKQQAELIDYARSASDSMFSYFNLSDYNPMDKPNYVLISKDANDKYTDSKMLFFLEVFILIKNYLTDILWWVFLVSFTWGAIDIGLNYEKAKENGKYIFARLGFAIGIYILFFASSNYQQINSNTGKIIEEESTRVQNLITLANKEINNMSDKITDEIFKLFLKNLNTREGVLNLSAMKAQEQELNNLLAQNKKLDEINNYCYETYDTTKLRDILSSLRKDKTTANKLVANPFPISEVELTTWVNNAYKSGTFGVLKKEYNPEISLTTCYQNKNKILSNENKISKIQTAIDNFNNKTFIAQKSEKIKNINDYIYSTYNEMGYFSLIFLPTLEALYSLEDAFKDKYESYQEVLKNYDYKSIAAGAVKNSALLTFLPLNSVQTFILNVSNILPTSWIPFGLGETASKITAGLLTLLATDFLSTALGYTKVLVFFIMGGYAFTLVIIQKLITYISSSFIIIYAFASNQTEKIIPAIANIAYVTIKNLLVIIAIIITMLALFVIQLLGNHYGISFVNLGESMGTLQGIAAWFLSGLFFLLQIALEVVVIVALLHHIPKSFASAIKLEVTDIADSVNSVIQSKIR